MRAWTLAFSLGLIVCGFTPQVPDFAIIFVVLITGLLLQLSRKSRLAGAFVLGCGWLLLYADQSLRAVWPEALEGVDVWTQGTVWTLPQQTERSLRFEFRIDKLCAPGSLAACEFSDLPDINSKVLINLYQDLPVEPGQRWQLQLRLRRPHGFANPGGFDYEAWLMQNGIRGTGYVRQHAGNILLEEGSQRYFTRLRFAVMRKLSTVEDLHYSHLIRALTIGEHYGISEDEWTLFRETGTQHLIVISGMHIALIALVLYRLAWWLVTRWTSLLLRWPAPQSAALFALAGAWLYSGLAGLSLPVQRAFVMAAVLFAGRLLRRQTAPLDALCLALALILALDPLAPQNAGFWLSYCAVAVLLLVATKSVGTENVAVPDAPEDGAGRRWSGLLAKLRLEWTTQWYVFIGLAPITLIFFQQMSPLAPLINMPAIPYIGLLVVPLALVAVLLLWIWPAAAEVLLTLTDLLLAGYMKALALFVTATPFDLVTLPTLSAPALGLLCAVIAVVLFAKGLKLRLAALVLTPLIFLWPRDRLPEGHVRVAVLDVGQGLAVVASTRDHHLLYDTGPYFSTRFDAGSDVVVPYLRHRNIRQLDTVIVSHADNDHAGGLAGVAAEFPDARYVGSAPDRFPLPGDLCSLGEAWTWNGVEFRILHPDRTGYDGNDSSCVLQISIGTAVILLPGDIERGAENRLLSTDSLRPATLLLAPHHGSNSSSTASFVAAVTPQAVVYASGYGNRFGHPRPEVRARYTAAGSAEYLTSRSGAVEFDIDAQGIREVRERRREHRRFWAWPL
jgi:competence protein ComEC